MPETPSPCSRIAHWPPVARIDAMYFALPTWQQFLLMFVTVAGGVQLPTLVTPGSQLAKSLSPVLVLGLFAGQVLLFTRINER